MFTSAGRNRELQGLARAIVKLWETSAIAKIAIKRGVPYTCNDRMAEELKVFLVKRWKLTTLLFYLIVLEFYHGKKSI